MWKFKIGDVVRFKSKEELMKITCFDKWSPKYKALAGKHVKIYKVLNHNNYAIQDGQEILGPYFQECYFEDLKDMDALLVEI